MTLAEAFATAMGIPRADTDLYREVKRLILMLSPNGNPAAVGDDVTLFRSGSKWEVLRLDLDNTDMAEGDPPGIVAVARFSLSRLAPRVRYELGIVQHVDETGDATALGAAIVAKVRANPRGVAWTTPPDGEQATPEDLYQLVRQLRVATSTKD